MENKWSLHKSKKSNKATSIQRPSFQRINKGTCEGNIACIHCVTANTSHWM